jgi:hypothetical protein
LGLSGNYPDGRTGNLPFIPFTRKNIAFAARTGLFYMVQQGIARRIFRIQTTILRFFQALPIRLCLCVFFPYSGVWDRSGRFSLNNAIMRSLFRDSSAFHTFPLAEYITHFSATQHRADRFCAFSFSSYI